jgi:hypothetical protein
MVETRRQKQALAAVPDPLREAGILKQVFAFVPGNYLFLGAVCREWNTVYVGIGAWQVRSISFDEYYKPVLCGYSTTLCSAAFASPTSARQACDSECGLQIRTKDNVQVVAGLHADIETLDTLSELGMPLRDVVLNAAALSGRLHIIQHLLTKQQCLAPLQLSHYAAHSGSIDMLDWLKAEGWCAFDTCTCSGAAKGGHLAALQYLHSEGCDWNAEYIARSAASSGSIEVVDWLRQQPDTVIDAGVMAAAVRADQIGMCEHLRSIGCEWDDDACDEAAVCGHSDMLRWLREHGCPWDVGDVCINAAIHGLTDILDYVIEQGEVLSAELLTETLNCAGAYSELQAAKWSRQHGAEWPDALTYGLQVQWSGESLAWARAEGCTSPVSP